MSIQKKKSRNFNDLMAHIYQVYGLEYDIPVLSLTFQVTDDCNLRCSYCYQIDKQHHVMPLQVAKDFIDILLEKKNNITAYCDLDQIPAIVIDFIGGEPLLQIDLIEQITDYFRQRTIELNHPWQYSYMISICSNGVLYFNDSVQKYLQKHKGKLSFCISIDGNKELHDSCRVFPDGSGSYDKAMEAVHHYRKTYSNDMGSKITIAQNSVQHTSAAVINLINEGYDEVFANCVFEKGWTIDHAKVYYNELKKIADYILDNDLEEDIHVSLFCDFGYQPQPLEDNQNFCGGDGRMMALDWKGDLYPCLRYMESSLGGIVPPLKVGNIYTGIMTDPKDIANMKALQAINRVNQSEQKCLDCPIAQGCAYCQAYNYQNCGEIGKRATYNCIMHKAASLANAYFWNKCYIKHDDQEDTFKIYLPDEDALEIVDQDELNMLHKLENKEV